jgi:Phosphotransferase enzyme family
LSTQGQPRELATQVLEHLLTWGVLTPQQLVSAPVRFSAPHSKNEVVLVESPEIGCIVYKAPPSHGNDQSLQAESEFYTATSRDARLAGLRPFIPRLLHYDTRLKSLVISSAMPALTAHEYLVVSGSVSSAILVQVGKALAVLHGALSGDRQPISGLATFRRVQPWILSLSTPGKGPLPRNQMAAALLHSVSQSGIVAQTIRSVALEPKTLSLVHGDMRLANVIITGPERAKVHLIDWELCGLGNPAWDLGALLGSLIYTSITRHDQPVGTQVIHNSIAAIVDVLEGYRFFGEGNRTPEAATQVVRYSALGLIQYGFEHAQVGVGSRQSDDMLLSIVEWMCSECHDLGFSLQKGRARGTEEQPERADSSTRNRHRP